jgi:hypothetical protein
MVEMEIVSPIAVSFGGAFVRSGSFAGHPPKAHSEQLPRGTLHREFHRTYHSPEPNGLCAAKSGVGGKKLPWIPVEASGVMGDLDRSPSRRSDHRHKRPPDSLCHEAFIEHLSHPVLIRLR